MDAADPANDEPRIEPRADAPRAPSTDLLARLESELAELEADLAAIDANDGSTD